MKIPITIYVAETTYNKLREQVGLQRVNIQTVVKRLVRDGLNTRTSKEVKDELKLHEYGYRVSETPAYKNMLLQKIGLCKWFLKEEE